MRGGTNEFSDDTIIDVVCGETFRLNHAVASCEHEGRTFYFNHIKCKLLFEREPQKYLGRNVAVGTAGAETRGVSPAPKSAARVVRRGRHAVLLALAALSAVAMVFVFHRAERSPPEAATEEPAGEPAQPSNEVRAAEGPAPAPAVTQDPQPPKTVKPPAPAVRKKVSRTEIPKDEARQQYELGSRYLKENDLERAVAAYERSVELNPKLAQAYGALGVVYKRQNRDALAVKALMTYLELMPTAHDADEVRKLIRESARTGGDAHE